MEWSWQNSQLASDTGVVWEKPQTAEMNAETLPRGPDSNMEYLETRPREGAEAETEGPMKMDRQSLRETV